MELNNHKGMEKNGMKQNIFKGKEQKRMKMNENKWNLSNLIWKQYGGNRMKSFYDNITIRPLF